MKILVIAPHADDGILGCGGSLIRLLSEGNEVRYLAFASFDPLLEETQNALTVLGINKNDFYYDPLEVRKFEEVRQYILEKLLLHKGEYKPDLVLLPSSKDVHQDHATFAREGFRAFKGTSMLGYELPWNLQNLNASYFIALQKSHLVAKSKAVCCYKSQMEKDYISGDFIYSLGKVRGVQVGADYAEAFEVVRWIM